MHDVLVIDDSPNTCDFLKTVLEAEGEFCVHIAWNGKDGLKMARKVRPALVILDLIMPEMDGFEVLTRLKDHPRLRAVPVVVLTGRHDKEALHKSLYLYADHFITKPVEPQVLIEKIKITLGLRRSET